MCKQACCIAYVGTLVVLRRVRFGKTENEARQVLYRCEAARILVSDGLTTYLTLPSASASTMPGSLGSLVHAITHTDLQIAAVNRGTHLGRQTTKYLT